MGYVVSKRSLDSAVAGLALVVLSPVLLVIAVIIRATMGSPVLFRQARPGRDGAPFELVKFRTMLDVEGSDAERLTGLGRFLRSTSLDELPELWNVLKGDMSLVGPRPLLPEYLPLYSAHHARRHGVRPGLTGLAQVRGRNKLSWDDRLDLDVEYVANHSMRLDLSILARTVLCVLRRDGISAEGEATMPRFTGSGVVIDLRDAPSTAEMGKVAVVEPDHGVIEVSRTA